jgi:hypothetical protein
LIQGWDSDTPDLDLMEIFNQIIDFSSSDSESNVSSVVGMNRDLMFGNQKAIYREYKNNEFNYVFEVNRNHAGYNYKDVHGQMAVISNRVDAMDRIDLLENCQSLQTIK